MNEGKLEAAGGEYSGRGGGGLQCSTERFAIFRTEPNSQLERSYGAYPEGWSSGRRWVIKP